MSTVQLRRYQILPAEMDAFVEWWPTILPAREQYGFEVIFAFVDESTNQFIWAVSHNGDFDEAERIYMASPQRAAVFANVPRRVAESFISKVTVVHRGWPSTI
jgi:NIPSNAP